MKQSKPIYLTHIEEAIANIESDLEGYDYERFRNERQVRQLSERNLEIISEASRRIPDSMKGQEPDIRWKEIAGIGNILRHDYHQSAPTVLWKTCTEDLAPLKAAIQRMRDRHE